MKTWRAVFFVLNQNSGLAFNQLFFIFIEGVPYQGMSATHENLLASFAFHLMVHLPHNLVGFFSPHTITDTVMLYSYLFLTIYLVTIFCQNKTKCCHLRLRKYWLHNRANIQDIFGKDLKLQRISLFTVPRGKKEKKSQVKTCSEGRNRQALSKSEAFICNSMRLQKVCPFFFSFR